LSRAINATSISCLVGCSVCEVNGGILASSSSDKKSSDPEKSSFLMSVMKPVINKEFMKIENGIGVKSQV
jgi:hypothetical protein